MTCDLDFLIKRAGSDSREGYDVGEGSFSLEMCVRLIFEDW